MELASEVAQQRPPFIGERGPELGDRIERLGDLEECCRIEPPTPGGALDRRSDVVGRADADRRALAEQLADLVGLVEAATDEHGVVGWLDALGKAATGREAGRSGEPVADRRELQQDDRLGVHQRAPRGPDTDGCPAIARRHGSSVQGGPA